VSLDDNAASREEVLARIRRAQGRGGVTPSQAERQAVATYVDAHPRGPTPPVEDGLVARFRTRAESMQSTFEEVASWAEVPAAAARYLAAHNLAPTGVVWPQLAALDWAAHGIRVEAREAKDADLVGITSCFAALAETGTLMTCTSAQTPGSASLLPETHIAVVPESRIVKHMEDGYALARAELGQLPRLVNFISGPSRTGDIDQTIVLGAHGPYRVHMILVRGA
jgi:L-lactate dehydrogenase complex protein LldG